MNPNFCASWKTWVSTGIIPGQSMENNEIQYATFLPTPFNYIKLSLIISISFSFLSLSSHSIPPFYLIIYTLSVKYWALYPNPRSLSFCSVAFYIYSNVGNAYSTICLSSSISRSFFNIYSKSFYISIWEP